jgi:hypothetical protein
MIKTSKEIVKDYDFSNKLEINKKHLDFSNKVWIDRDSEVNFLKSLLMYYPDEESLSSYMMKIDKKIIKRIKVLKNESI